VGEWVFFMHPPRDDFIATMTDAERSAFGAHEEAARRVVADEPVTSGGYMDGDLRPYRLGLLRGRDR